MLFNVNTILAPSVLSALLYLREVAEDGSVLAGVELELPADGVEAVGQRKFFWSVAWFDCFSAYDQAATEAIRFLQGVYGFVVRDYNYECMMSYRDSLRSAITVAASAIRCVVRLEREASHVEPNHVVSTVVVPCPPLSQIQFDWQLLYSRLLASLRYV